jgi:predicted XRE-type DNA-binding protein
MTTSITPSTGDVFRDIGFNETEAEDLRLRSDLMMALRDKIAALKKRQTEIAGLLGVSQPRISDLMRGKIHLFGAESLAKMLARLGASIDVKVLAPANDSVFISATSTAIACPALLYSSTTGVGLVFDITTTCIFDVGVSILSLDQSTVTEIVCPPQDQSKVTVISQLAANTQLALAA